MGGKFVSRLYLRTLLVAVLASAVLAGIGLTLINRYEYSAVVQLTSSRIGNLSSRVAHALEAAPNDPAVQTAVLETLLAERAVLCAEITAAGAGILDGVLAEIPAGVGCRGQSREQRLSLNLEGAEPRQLTVFFSEDIAASASSEANTATSILLLGTLLVSILATSLAFSIRVGRPLKEIGDVIRRRAPEIVTAAPAENTRGRDELEELSLAFSQMIEWEERREAQKMSAIGELTGGLAHNFNNLLGIVIGHLDEINESLTDEKLRRSLHTALDAALRGSNVARSLLAVARRQPLSVARQDINSLIEEMSPLIISAAGRSTRVQMKLCEGKLEGRVDAAGLCNAVLNLIANSRESMRRKAGVHELQVRTRRVPVTSAHPEFLPAGEYALVEVQDNGSGMSEEAKRRAFEPFYSSKEMGRATGLGLSAVHGFAEQHGGLARIRTALGSGTTVEVYLRLTTEEVAEGAGEVGGNPVQGPAVAVHPAAPPL